MFECITVLILQLAKIANIKIRKGQQHVRAKRFLACLVGQIFRDLATGTCECMDGHRIAVFKKQHQRGAKLSPRDLSFVELHWSSEAGSHAEATVVLAVLVCCGSPPSAYRHVIFSLIALTMRPTSRLPSSGRKIGRR